jgi:hypothetical protein
LTPMPSRAILRLCLNPSAENAPKPIGADGV